MTAGTTVDRINQYGSHAKKLWQLGQNILDSRNKSREVWGSALTSLFNFVDQTAPAQNVLEQLSKDKRQEVREVAAYLIRCLWQYWKVIPYQTESRRAYDAHIHAHAKSLRWTIPIIKSLLKDRAIKPLDEALYIIWEMENAPKQSMNQLKILALRHTHHASPDIRYSLVRTLYCYYPTDKQSQYILDDALMFYIDSTYDSCEKVRDWACFELWLSIANLNEEVAKAFQDAINRESPISDVYAEAVIGAARLGLNRERIDAIICDNLDEKDFGTAWIDAVEQSGSGKCLESLVKAYSKILKADSKDYRLEAIENAFEDWNI